SRTSARPSTCGSAARRPAAASPAVRSWSPDGDRALPRRRRRCRRPLLHGAARLRGRPFVRARQARPARRPGAVAERPGQLRARPRRRRARRLEPDRAAGRRPRAGRRRLGARRRAGRRARRQLVPGARPLAKPDRAVPAAMIRPAELIERKREEWNELMAGYALGEVPDYQLAALCMAIFFRGLTSAETFAFTQAMIA